MLYLWIGRGVWEAFCVCCSPIHRKREVLLFIIFFFYNLMFIWYFKCVKKTEKMDFKRQKTN